MRQREGENEGGGEEVRGGVGVHPPPPFFFSRETMTELCVGVFVLDIPIHAGLFLSLFELL